MWSEPAKPSALTADVIYEAFTCVNWQNYAKPQRIIVHPDMLLPVARAFITAEYYKDKPLRRAFYHGYVEGRKSRPLKPRNLRKRFFAAWLTYCQSLAEARLPDKNSAISWLSEHSARESSRQR